VGSGEPSKVLQESLGAQKVKRIPAGAIQSVPEGEEEGSEIRHVVGMEVRQENVGECLPGKAEAGEGPNGSGPTIHEEA
jgi:hypothetical protein